MKPDVLASEQSVVTEQSTSGGKKNKTKQSVFGVIWAHSTSGSVFLWVSPLTSRALAFGYILLFGYQLTHVGIGMKSLKLSKEILSYYQDQKRSTTNADAFL